MPLRSGASPRALGHLVEAEDVGAGAQTDLKQLHGIDARV